MKTIVEPKEHIKKLWGKQKIELSEVYRLMRYVLRVDRDGKVLLHNVVTGQLVVLDQDEAKVLSFLPMKYCPEMRELVEGHYLVSEDFDEHIQIRNMRHILRMYNESQSNDDITAYTILTTTACNARCYYCFEKGAKVITMSEQTANDVVRFIKAHCRKEKAISIAWFGGEPTLTPDRIDQICLGLRENDIAYTSKITTNGYLMDKALIIKAKEIWNLKSVNISMDGTEERYNRIKSYVNPKDDPYQKVMENIGLLLEEGIAVNLRMNFDKGNYEDFRNLVHDAACRYGRTSLLNVSAHQINGDYRDSEDNRQESEEWFSEKIVELNDIAREAGLYRKNVRLPSLISVGCKASMNSMVTITPEGNLVRCPEQFGEDQITGNIWDGVTNTELVGSWKELADYEKCFECVFYPRCLTIRNCSARDRCCHKLEYSKLYGEAIKQRFYASHNESMK